MKHKRLQWGDKQGTYLPSWEKMIIFYGKSDQFVCFLCRGSSIINLWKKKKNDIKFQFIDIIICLQVVSKELTPGQFSETPMVGNICIKLKIKALPSKTYSLKLKKYIIIFLLFIYRKRCQITEGLIYRNYIIDWRRRQGLRNYSIEYIKIYYEEKDTILNLFLRKTIYYCRQNTI